MGYNDVEWAYSLDLPMREKVILAALCHRTNDLDHSTIIGQNSIAEMTGADRKTVNRALKVLDELGVLTRVRRSTAYGYRTSDTTVVNVKSYVPDSPLGDEAYVPDSPSLSTSQSIPMYLTVHPYVPEGYSNKEEPEEKPVDQPEEKPDTGISRFDDFYSIWPRKVNRPAAERAWQKAIKRHSADKITEAAIAFRDNPHIPAKKYIPHPATWLNADGWNDDLPTGGPTDQTPLERAAATRAAGERVAAARQAMFGNVKEITA